MEEKQLNITDNPIGKIIWKNITIQYESFGDRYNSSYHLILSVSFYLTHYENDNSKIGYRVLNKIKELLTKEGLKTFNTDIVMIFGGGTTDLRRVAVYRTLCEMEDYQKWKDFESKVGMKNPC